MSSKDSSLSSERFMESGSVEASDRTPTTEPSRERRELHVPSHECYWAVLPVDRPLPSTVWTGQDSAAQFEDEFQAIIPIDLASLHAAYVPAGSGTVLACGVAQSLAIATSGRCLSLAPDSIPPELGEFPEPPEVELLGGDCEPKLVARARTRLFGTIAASIALTGLVTALGLEQRRRYWESFASAADTQRITALQSRWKDADAVTASRQLALQLEEARLTHGRQLADAPDAAANAAEVLGVMNALAGVDTEVVSCTESSVVVTITAPDERRTLIEQIGPPSGWALAEPRLLATPHGTQFTLQFARRRGGLP